MAKKAPKNAADFIAPLNMNGLQGRMLHVPAPKNNNREILMIYGHHALIEPWWGLIENYYEYGAVTMPDLAGFGGMESFYKIGQKPTIDNFADYLAAFIRLRYKRRRVTIVGISFGFVIATRMLQRYPDLARKIDLLVSIVGFMHKDDFLFKSQTRKASRFLSRGFATLPVALFIRYVLLNRLVITTLYSRLPAGKRRLLDLEAAERDVMLDYDVRLWQVNDVRTHWWTTSEFLGLDNCITRINVPVWHVAAKHDHYFNNQIVEQHMLIVFNDYQQVYINSKAHTPGVLADKKGLSVLLPTRLRRVLDKQNS